MPKTIFGTSEKSNFILNMNKSTVKKWVTGLLCACIILPLIGSIFITAVPAGSSFLASFLYATGFSCILFYIVLLLRKDIVFKDYPAAFLVAGLAALAFASYYRLVIGGADSLAINTALLGESGRYEGLISLLAYPGIFLLATAAADEASVKRVFDILVGAGIVQAAAAVLQHIPCGFPSDFRDLPALLLLKDVHLSSGLSGNPIFYGSFLTLVSGVAVIGALYEKNCTRAKIYGWSAVLFFLTGLFTSSVVPLIGIGAVIVIAVINEFTAGRGGTKFEGGFLNSSRKRLAAIIIAFAVVFAVVFAFQGIYLRDKAIAYTDSFYRLFIVSSPSPVNTDSLWKIGAEKSFGIIKQHPILGAGPDMMASVLIAGGDEKLIVDSIERSYNEYIYIAATRGIPSLLVYIALLGMTFVKLFKDVKEFAADREKWFRPALLTAVIAYSVQAFFSASVITVAPFFWLLLGLAWSKFLDEKKVRRK